MPNQFIIVFLGICVAIQSGAGPDYQLKMMMPVLKGTEVVAGNQVIPKHRAFIMFRKDKYVSSSGGWGQPQVIVKNGVARDFYLLNGDTISLSHAAEPLSSAAQVSTAFHLTANEFCPSFGALGSAYAAGNDPATTAVEFDATYGSLRMVRKFMGMRATELTMHSDQTNLVVTATSLSNGASRTVTIAPGGEVWIGNMSEDFLDPAMPHSNTAHFLAYYLFSAQPNECAALPDDPPATPAHPAPAKHKDLGVTCSNTNYP